MEKYTVHVGNVPIVFEHQPFEGHIDVDALTKIDASNIFGEAVTATASANRVGHIKSEVEGDLATAKLDLKIFESDFKDKLRKSASENSGSYIIRVDNADVKVKSSEKALEVSFQNDPRWIELSRKVITLTKATGHMTSVHWSAQQKCRNLTNVVSNVTPEQFSNELVEGLFNHILIKK